MPGANVRVAYVGYRDFGDIGDEEHFDILHFTNDVVRAKEKIGRSKASGGRDWPEDVIGGIKKALKFDYEA